MAFDNYEAPHTRYYENDLTEMIRLYKKLLGEYDEILETSRQLQEQLAHLPQTVQTLVDAATAELRIEIEEELEGLQADVAQTVAQLRAQEAILEARINAKVDGLEATVNNNFEVLSTRLETQKADYIARTAYMQTEIDELRFTLPDIYNPVEGRMTSIQQAILDLFSLFATAPITAGEYDALNLSASIYDNRNITAFDYDTKGKQLLA